MFPKLASKSTFGEGTEEDCGGAGAQREGAVRTLTSARQGQSTSNLPMRREWKSRARTDF